MEGQVCNAGSLWGISHLIIIITKFGYRPLTTMGRLGRVTPTVKLHEIASLRSQ
jgi:hypothetical protein